MTDFVSTDGIHFDDFNDEFNFIVCVEEPILHDEEGEAGAWAAKKETIKVFNPDQKNDAENYALRLVKNLSEFKNGSKISLSTHKNLFDF